MTGYPVPDDIYRTITDRWRALDARLNLKNGSPISPLLVLDRLQQLLDTPAPHFSTEDNPEHPISSPAVHFATKSDPKVGKVTGLSTFARHTWVEYLSDFEYLSTGRLLAVNRVKVAQIRILNEQLALYGFVLGAKAEIESNEVVTHVKWGKIPLQRVLSQELVFNNMLGTVVYSSSITFANKLRTDIGVNTILDLLMVDSRSQRFQIIFSIMEFNNLKLHIYGLIPDLKVKYELYARKMLDSN
jgi:hypothetical protein